MDAKTKVTYLRNELIASQGFHTIGLGTTTLEVLYNEERIAIEFVVSDAPSQDVNTMWAQVVSPDRMQVHLVNFKQIMPAQVIGPFDVGTMAGRPLTIVVEVSGVKNTPCKYIRYSLYAGGANG